MWKKSRHILLFILFSFLVVSQSVQTASTFNVNDFYKTSLSSANYNNDVNIAHITTPTTVPIINYDEPKTTLPSIRKFVYRLLPITHQLYPFSHKTEWNGFIDVQKYKSNYLP